MLMEAIVLEINQDLAEVVLFDQRKEEFIFLPKRIWMFIHIGMRLLLIRKEDTLEIYGITHAF